MMAGVGLALAALRAHKLRSFLTVLGVIIGTGTIIGVGSILTGFDGAVTGVIKTFGTDSMIITKYRSGITFGNRSREEIQRKPLTYANALAIRERCRTVESVSMMLRPQRGIHRAHYKNNDVYQINLFGADEKYAATGNAEMKQGRFYSEFENVHHEPVVVIGEDLYKNLFSGTDVIGREMQLDGHSYRVIGVMSRPANSFPGQQDTRAVLPYFTMRKLEPSAVEHIFIVASQPGLLSRAMDETRGVLRQERRLKFNEPDNFGISTADQMIEQFRQVTAVTALVMIVLSSIGLLVGGIGVMNIMLVSVTERTREIGVRKAIGARRIDIIVQFLTEAVVLTFTGGLFGMLVGWLISLGAGLLFPTLPTSVPVWAAVTGVLMSVGVGVFFGLWPATKAARLDPVDALRYE
jgi:putative ABC transport system permease protein